MRWYDWAISIIDERPDDYAKRLAKQGEARTIQAFQDGYKPFNGSPLDYIVRSNNVERQSIQARRN